MKFIRPIPRIKINPNYEKMLDYLIERAELLDAQTQFNDSAFDDGWKAKKQELSRLLEIIRTAGVEVEI